MNGGTPGGIVLLSGAALFSYLLGSIPFGLILARLGGAGDIRLIGSGNIGATNVLRTGRRGLAAATLLLDGLKGVAAVLLCRFALPLAPNAAANMVPNAVPGGAVDVAAVAAVCVVLGHCFPVWLRGRGGKGVATGLGAVLALDWRAGILCCLAWLLVARLSRISSAGALAAFALPAPLLLVLGSWGPDGWGPSWEMGAPLAWAGLAITLIVWGRHHANIARLLSGTEPRIGGRPA